MTAKKTSRRLTFTPSVLHAQPQILRQILDRQGRRRVIGECFLSVAALKREVQIWQLEDEECLVMLLEGGHLYHWEPSAASFDEVYSSCCNWLAAPPS